MLIKNINDKSTKMSLKDIYQVGHVVESAGQLLVVFCVDDKYSMVLLGDDTGATLANYNLFNSLDDLITNWGDSDARLVTELDYKATDREPKEN